MISAIRSRSNSPGGPGPARRSSRSGGRPGRPPRRPTSSRAAPVVIAAATPRAVAGADAWSDRYCPTRATSISISYAMSPTSASPAASTAMQAPLPPAVTKRKPGSISMMVCRTAPRRIGGRRRGPDRACRPRPRRGARRPPGRARPDLAIRSPSCDSTTACWTWATRSTRSFTSQVMSTVVLGRCANWVSLLGSPGISRGSAAYSGASRIDSLRGRAVLVRGRALRPAGVVASRAASARPRSVPDR